jgi:hypothetical protein
MKTLRVISWSLIAILALHGSGVLSSLHHLTHHTDAANAIESSCATSHVHTHAHEQVDDHDDDQSDQPTPSDEHGEECSFCLGLSGLHLVASLEPVRIIPTTITEIDRSIDAQLVYSTAVLVDHPARAPPVC